jgi:hypothetical protein
MLEDSRTTTGFHSIRCPFCEVYDLEQPAGSNSAHCTSSGGSLDAAFLTTLWEIQTLPNALGSHPCEECGHPEMRRLPDGIFHCFACGSEVVPAAGSSAESSGGARAVVVSEAYLSGWMDGLFGSAAESFVNNRELARWEEAVDRLDYYRGHHAGRKAFLGTEEQPRESIPNRDPR